jgi:hypothetical protein
MSTFSTFLALPVLASALLVKQAPDAAPALPPLNGVFCRGSACQYRVNPPPPSEPITNSQEAAALGLGAELAQKEFCRGLACIEGSGRPEDTKRATFVTLCSRLFEKSGGLPGTDRSRTIANVRDAFTVLCKPRTGNGENVLCPAYADVWVAALSQDINDPSVGSLKTVCGSMYDFLGEFKQAEVDMGFWEPAVPADPLNQAGPHTTRGARWHKHAATHQVRLLQAPVVRTEAVNVTEGSYDDVLKPVSVPPAVFSYCEAEMSEIMLSSNATSSDVIKLTRDWCSWRSMLKGEEGAKPDWTERTCLNMGKLVTYALRNIPDPTPTTEVVWGKPPQPAFGLPSPTMPPEFAMIPNPEKPTQEDVDMMYSPNRFLMNSTQVCQQIFVAIAAVHRTEGLLRDPGRTSYRLGVSMPKPELPSAHDAALLALKAATDYRSSTANAQVEAQEKAAQVIEAAKAANAVPSSEPVKPEEPVVMPDSSAFNPEVHLN